MTLKHAAALFISGNGVISFTSNIFYSVQKSTKSAFRIVTSALPVIYYILASYLLFRTEFYSKHPSIALWITIPLFSSMNSKMVVCNVSKMDISPIQPIIVPWLLLIYNPLGLPESQILILIFATNLLMYAYFVVTTITQICNCLGIYCLSIKKQKK